MKKIDFLLISHYHADHVGGLYDVAQKFPIHTFIDHSPNTEMDKDSKVRFNMYTSFAEKGTHIIAKPGDTIPIKGLDVKILSSAGQTLAEPLPGAGQPNPDCAGYQ
ncbi:MAG TPA: MBL fold metallo-hydrolase, partial [Bryobacteraceae bacterium]